MHQKQYSRSMSALGRSGPSSAGAAPAPSGKLLSPKGSIPVSLMSASSAWLQA